MWYQCRSIIRKVRTHTSILNNPNLTKEEKKIGKEIDEQKPVCFHSIPKKNKYFIYKEITIT